LKRAPMRHINSVAKLTKLFKRTSESAH
jgi:hypothetical protein